MSRTIPARLRRAMQSTRIRLAIRLIVTIGVLLAVIAHVGARPLIHGLLSLDLRTISAAMLLGAVATAAAAWRWRLIAHRLGVELRRSTAIGMYYRSQFLNTVLPGGIVGDVQRAVSAGGSPEGITQSVRSVAIERSAGQIVQLTITLAVVTYLGTEFEGYFLAALGIGIGLVVVPLLVANRASLRARNALTHEARELRAGLGSVRTSLSVAIASTVVVACHVATFTIATAAVGARVSPLQTLTLALVVLLGASIPLNVGGWGPREGVAGWAFALAGFGASSGVSASTLFGALTIISVVPGAIVTVVSALRRRKTTVAVRSASLTPVLVLATTHQEKAP